MNLLPKRLIRPHATAGVTAHPTLPSGGYISFWEMGDAITTPPHIDAAASSSGDLPLLEIKTKQATDFSFDVSTENHPFWLIFSFIGSFAANQPFTIDAGQYCVCSFKANWATCRLTTDAKGWLFMLGIPPTERQALLEEWPQIENGIPQKIGYRQQQVLKKLQQVPRKPYSTGVKVHEAMVQLLDIFHADMLDVRKYREMDQLALYHRAMMYIRAHYLDAGIDRNRIAEALHVSVRTLNRSFEGKSNNVMATIRMVRLYNARDLLRNSDLSLEEIAFKLHYTDAKHLSRKYQALFNRSPTQERNMAAKEYEFAKNIGQN